MYNKKKFNDLAQRFYRATGYKATFENQYENGKWLHIDSLDNDGDGMYFEVDGYFDAYNTLFNMLAGFRLSELGRFC